MVDHTSGLGEKAVGTERQQAKLCDLAVNWNVGAGVLRATATDGQALWVAYHSKEVVGNGWEPYDQPSTAAYIPWALRDVKAKVSCEDGSRILFATWGSFCVSRDDLVRIMFAAEIIVPVAHRQACLDELERVVTIAESP